MGKGGEGRGGAINAAGAAHGAHRKARATPPPAPPRRGPVLCADVPQARLGIGARSPRAAHLTDRTASSPLRPQLSALEILEARVAWRQGSRGGPETPHGRGAAGADAGGAATAGAEWPESEQPRARRTKVSVAGRGVSR